MRFLLATIGTRGDVQPMALAAAALIARGHQAVLAAPPDGRGIADAWGVPFVPCGRDVTAWLADLDVARLGMRGAFNELRRLLIADIGTMTDVLVDAAAGCDVVVGAGLQPLGQTVADVVGARAAYVYFAPNLVPSAAHPPIFLPFGAAPRFVNRAGHRFARMMFDRIIVPPVNAARARHGLAPDKSSADTMPRELLLAYDPAVIAGPVDLLPWFRTAPGGERRAVQTGALVPPPLPLDADLAHYVAGGPCAYVGFGSMPDQHAAATLALVDDAAARAGVRVVMLGRGASTERVRVVASASHAALFPLMGAVAHHCGVGTSATASRAGVPQVAVPHFVDQPLWATMLGRRGVLGGRIGRRRLTAARLATALLRCFDDAGVQQRARDLRDALATTDPAARFCEAVLAIGGERGGVAAPRVVDAA